MIITQAPLRVSFLGGGTDFPDHFREHGGAVLATAIDRCAYVTVQPFYDRFFDHRLRISYRKTEAVQNAADIEHPAIRACLQKLRVNEGIELHHMADLPARTGLGSSSTFVVAMLQALHAFAGRFRTADDLAREAIEVEREILGEAGGYQDQIISAVGGTSYVRFERNGSFSVSQLPLTPARVQELNGCLLMIYTGIQRESYTVQKTHIARIGTNRHGLCELSAMAREGAVLLAGAAPIAEFGHLLHEGWRLKRSLADVSLPEIDDAYDVGRQAGAWGGKLLGAGRGGFLLFMAPPERHDAIRLALRDRIHLRFGINAPGSRVIFAQNPR
jgi:D-glycero-alpha-D-manno-heptose-7-phosphate kinase